MAARRVLAAAGAATGIAIFGAGLGTGALWNDSASLDGGQVRSGELSLLNGNAATQVSDYAFEELAGSALRPGVAVQAPLTIKNGGTADLTYRLAQTSATGSAALPAAMELAVTRVAGTSGCATGVGVPAPGAGTVLYDGPFAGAATATGRFLPTTASEVLCLRLVVAASAGDAVQSVSSRVIFTFAAVST